MRGQQLQHDAEMRRTDDVCKAESGKFRVVLVDQNAQNFFPSTLGDFNSPEEAMNVADLLNFRRRKDTAMESYVVYDDRGEVVVPEKPDGETLN